MPETELYDLAVQMNRDGEDIRRQTAIGLLGGQKRFSLNNDSILDKNEEIQAEYGENAVTLTFGSAKRELSYQELGDAFYQLIKNEHDDIVHGRTMENLQYIIPNLSDEMAENLIQAFDESSRTDWENNLQKKRQIKRALYEILGDDEQTEKAFASIAYLKYDYKVPVKPDFLEFRFGGNRDKDWFTESELLAEIAEQNPEMSFALANAVMEYLDEKQHSERNIKELHAGWYSKTDFEITASVNGEDFHYEGRFDIGDGKNTGGGSLIDHIRTFNEGIINYTQYPYNQPEYKEKAQHTLDVLIPFLEKHSVLTPEEEKILSDFKEKYPIRTFDDVKLEQPEPEQNKIHQVITNAGYDGGIDDKPEILRLNGYPDLADEVQTADTPEITDTQPIDENTPDEEVTQTIQESKQEPVKPDFLEFHFGIDEDREWFTESELLSELVGQNPNISFALANAVMEYLDEKQHSERDIEGLHVGWYDKTDFEIIASVGGEDFHYADRFDIGDGKSTNGGSLIDHIRTLSENYVNSVEFPYNHPEYEEEKNILDVFVPFLEKHSVLTPEEEKILSDFKEKYPIRTAADVEIIKMSLSDIVGRFFSDNDSVVVYFSLL